MTAQEKNLLCGEFNKNFRCDGNQVLYNIYSDFEKRFVEQDFLKNKYYFEECRFDVKCTIFDDFIEKECTKTMYFKPYTETLKLNEFNLGEYKNSYTGSKNSFEFKSLEEDGKPIKDKDVKKYIKEEVVCDSKTKVGLEAKNGYTSHTKCMYKKGIDISSKKPFCLSYTYITRTSIDDNIYTVRCSQPCKKFSVNFTITNKDYEAKAIGFGFIDRAKNTPNMSIKQSVSVEFRNWILPEDGVVILINKM